MAAAMNTKSVVTSGLAAGLVLNVIDFVSNTFILGERMKMELDAVNPSLWTAMNATSNIAWFVGIDFVLGILIVWLYAGLRPRFGAGPGTAIKAGAYVWGVATLMWMFFYLMGMFSTGSFATGAAIALVNCLLAAWVGGKLYSEAA